MALRANYFKLGIFVIGALAAGVIVLLVIGSGRWFKPRLTVETYFNESVQGLDIGSKVRYRGVVIGEVTRITFTYVKYQQDRDISERTRYVLVEFQIEPQLLGNKMLGSEFTGAENRMIEVERGLRVRLAPQGITGTNYLEIDYVDPKANPPPKIDWQPEIPYIPSASSTVTQFVNSATEIVDRLRKLDLESTLDKLNTLLVTTNDRVAALDTKALSQTGASVLAKVDRTLDRIAEKDVVGEAAALLAEVRESNAELKKTLANPALAKLPEDAVAAVARVRALVEDPNLSKSIASLAHSMNRLERMIGGSQSDIALTAENLRQITDNLRDLTEEAKRYPASVLFGGPPSPLERKP